MKKIISKLIPILSLALLIWPSFTFAQLTNLKNATPTSIQNADIYSIIGTFIQALLGFVGVLFIVMVIYGGVTWMTAGGDSGKVQKAKDTIVKALIGLVIIMSAYAIVYSIIQSISGV